MQKFVDVLISWGPLGLFVLAILDSAGVPLPAAVDGLLIATAAVNPAAAYVAALMAVLGSALGCLFLFYLGRKGGEAYLDRVTQSDRARQFRTWFQTYGLITVFVPAFVPIVPLPLKIFVLSAGALGVKPLTYLLVVLAARVPRYFGMAWLGSQLGRDAWGWLKGHTWPLALGALVMALALGLMVRLVTHRKLSAR